MTYTADMNRLIAAGCLTIGLLLGTACTAAPAATGPAAVDDAPVAVSLAAPGTDGQVTIRLAVRVSGAASFRFFQRSGTQDQEIPVQSQVDGSFTWDVRGLAVGVYTIWASAYGSDGRLLGSSVPTSVALSAANTATLAPLRGAVRDAG